MITSNIDLEKLFSYRKETLYHKECGFQIQKIITLTYSQTYYVALDPTAMIGTSKKLGLFPLSFQYTAGLCLAYTYASTLSVTGTELIPQKVIIRWVPL